MPQIFDKCDDDDNNDDVRNTFYHTIMQCHILIKDTSSEE